MNPNIEIKSYHLGGNEEMITRWEARDKAIRDYLENYDTKGVKVEVGMAAASNDEGGDVVVRVYTNEEYGQRILKEKLDHELEKFRGDL